MMSCHANSAKRDLNHAFIERRIYLCSMLCLAAILRFSVPQPQPNDLLAHARLRLGNVGLTIIALIYVLITFWQS
jgi:hypothetical protein